jgi:hypothetical protein
MSSPERNKTETAAVLCDRLKLWGHLIRSDREVRLLSPAPHFKRTPRDKDVIESWPRLYSRPVGSACPFAALPDSDSSKTHAS